MNTIGNRVPFQAKSMQLKPAQVEQEQPEKVETKETEQAPETENANPTAESVEVLGTPSYLAQRGIKIVSSTTPLSATSADEIVETEVVDDEEVVTNDADTDAAKTKQYAQKKPPQKSGWGRFVDGFCEGYERKYAQYDDYNRYSQYITNGQAKSAASLGILLSSTFCGLKRGFEALFG